MSKLRPISILELFRTYHDRDEYLKATGEEAPAWNPNRPVKVWFDPGARDGFSKYRSYPIALRCDRNGMVLPNTKGQPTTMPMQISSISAGTVNMLPRERMADYGPGSKVTPIPTPLRALRDDEELVFTFGGVVAVRVKEVKEWVSETYQHLSSRELLEAIARKLGVL
jgi:hypothetical protein